MADRDFASDLESLRRTAGFSLRELVRSTGVPRSTLSDALAGRRVPRLETVLAIVRACGADPGPWRRRWAAMSRQERPPDKPATGDEPGTAPLPAQLPIDVAGFASREHELARLGRSGVALIHGRPGVGKTALAVHWAHSVATRYPDGQVFLNLRGHHASLGPMSTVEALGRLLGSLGVVWAPLNQDPDVGASLWRSTLAGRRVLIVLDDAVSAEQVRPLLPGTAGCTTLVTSRRYLADLVAHEGADGVALDVLPAGSSLALLAHTAGEDRIAAEPEQAAAVTAACGHLPLALRLAGAVLAGAPDLRIVHLLAELGAGDRLGALENMARPSTVEGTFELSYGTLSGNARFLFRRLGLHPGPTISVAVAALLADTDPGTADRLLRTLAEAHLIEPVRADRYRMHDLLRDYAARLVADSDSPTEQRDAYRRLMDWYVDRALGVSAALDRGRERLWVHDDLSSSWDPGHDVASAWVEAEHRNVAALIEYDARRRTGHYAWALVDLMAGVLSRRQDISGLIVATDAALDAARRQGDTHAEGTMHLRRGWLRWRGGQVAGATDDFARARTLFEAAGVRRAQASALRGLSVTRLDIGQLADARAAAEAAVALYRAEGDRVGEAVALNTIAVFATRTADFTVAVEYMEAARVLHLAGGNRGYLAMTLGNLAHLHLVRGAIGPAIARAEEAVATAREVGDGVSETLGLINGALAHAEAGTLAEAHQWATAAIARARAAGYRYGDACALDVLATVERRLGRPGAQAHRQEALRLVRKVGDLAGESDILVSAARDLYRAAVDASQRSREAFRAARDAAEQALDVGLAADTPHSQAEAFALLAACDLGLGEVADAEAEARQAVEMHVRSGARLAEIVARCVLAHALYQSDADAAAEWRIAADIVDQLALPATATVRRILSRGYESPLPLAA